MRGGGSRGRATLFVLLSVVAMVGCGVDGTVIRPAAGSNASEAHPAVPGSSDPGASRATAPTVPPTTTPVGPRSDSTILTRSRRITGEISPKSVVASGHGLVFAQNMVYRHTVTAYRADGELAATIPDGVDLSAFGIDGHPGVSTGGPAEAAFTGDGGHAYVSNYSMHGTGFGPEGVDSCTPSSGYDDSYLYRIDTKSFEIDQVIPVGSVPKYVAVTPDDSTVLVTNWCSFDLSIVDVATAREVARVPIGRHPRGIVVSPDSTTAYVAVMGGSEVVRVDLAARSATKLAAPGSGPRHIVISPDGSTLYVSNNGSGTITSVSAETGKVLARVSVGSQPRSLAISADGSALYAVSYESSTVTKLRASDLLMLDRKPTDHHPIGITYEPTTRSIWVACYGGSIIVYDDNSVG